MNGFSLHIEPPSYKCLNLEEYIVCFFLLCQFKGDNRFFQKRLTGCQRICEESYEAGCIQLNTPCINTCQVNLVRNFIKINSNNIDIIIQAYFKSFKMLFATKIST